MKEWSIWSYLVMKNPPRVTDDRPLMATRYKYNSWKVLVFIATDGSVSTGPGNPYLQFPPYTYYNVYIRSVCCPLIIYRYLNYLNLVDNHNNVLKYYLAIEKYWVTQSGYFRLADTAALGMGINTESYYYVMIFQRKLLTGKVQ